MSGLGVDGEGAAERGQPVGHALQAGAVAAVVVSKPVPLSVTENWRLPPEPARRTVAWEAPAYLATFCSASSVQK